MVEKQMTSNRNIPEITEDVLGKPDRARQMAEVALNAGRAAQSPHTGFFHYHYNRSDFPAEDTIPIVENFLYSLALMRDRTKEGVHEGKRLLERLLHFQNLLVDERKGLFPVYLHEYPECRDLYISAQILPTLYWILAEFGSVLGSILKGRVEQTVKLLLEQAKQLQAEAKLPFGVAIKLAGAQAGFGLLLEQSELHVYGREILLKLHQRSRSDQFIDWFVPETIADTLIGLQLGYAELSDSPWAEFGEWLATSWNVATCSYIGPTLDEQQENGEPKTTLYDLFLGYYTGAFSFRALLNKPLGVRAAIVHASADKLFPIDLPMAVEGVTAERAWQVIQREKYACSLLGKNKPSTHAGYTPLKIIWGDINNTHTLVCSGGNAEEITFRSLDYGIDLYFTLPEEVPTEAKQKNREIMFFADKHEGLEVTIGSDRVGTAFPLGETIVVSSMGRRFCLRFCLDEGQGRFFGHIAQGNRPNQIGAIGEERFTAFDWQIFLRTLERTPQCRIRVEVRFL